MNNRVECLQKNKPRREKESEYFSRESYGASLTKSIKAVLGERTNSKRAMQILTQNEIKLPRKINFKTKTIQLLD